MQITQDLVERLLATTDAELQPNDFLLSVYYPNRNYNRDQFKQRVRSYVIEHCRNSAHLSGHTDIHQLLGNKIEESIETTSPENIAQGIALFMTVIAESHHCELEIVPLPFPPYKSCSIGKIYNVDQLASVSQQAAVGLVIYLNRNYSELFLLENDDLTKLIHVENKVQDKDANKFTEKQASPTIYPGVGENRMQQRHHEENKSMLNDVKKYITDNYENFSYLPYIVVMYTSQMAEIAEEFLDDIGQVFNSAEPLAISKNPTTQDDICVASVAAIRERVQMRPNDLLDAAQELPAKYTDDLEDVITAAREGRIRRLFLKPNLAEAGYTNGEGLVSTTSLEDTWAVDNVIPLVVKQVVQTSAEVLILDPEDPTPTVAAELRY